MYGDHLIFNILFPLVWVYHVTKPCGKRERITLFMNMVNWFDVSGLLLFLLPSVMLRIRLMNCLSSAIAGVRYRLLADGCGKTSILLDQSVVFFYISYWLTRDNITGVWLFGCFTQHNLVMKAPTTEQHTRVQPIRQVDRSTQRSANRQAGCC
jgi:hypothetical protein